MVYDCIDVDRDGWRRWRGSFDKEAYPRIWLGRKRGGYAASYRLIYTWEVRAIPAGWTIDHACGEKDCMDHLECVTRAENLRRRHARERGELRTGHGGLIPPRVRVACPRR
jgi:HNH endonuclease